MGVVQKGPTSTLFFGPQKTSFFRLFSTFSGFFQKKKKDKNQKKIKQPKKSKTIKKRQKNEKSIKTKSHLFEWDRKNRIQKMAISKREKRPGKKRPFFGVKCTKNR